MSSPVVLITGALTGIGRATALAFAQEGARVVVSGRHDDKGEKLATELRTLGTEAEFLRTDVRHEEKVKNLVDKTILVSAASTLPSVTLAPKAFPVRLPMSPPRTIKPSSTQTCSVCF
jgi:NAD(P)-dependent dehydrogenase (short-subunit alcohol dehydrogenase family)